MLWRYIAVGAESAGRDTVRRTEGPAKRSQWAVVAFKQRQID